MANNHANFAQTTLGAAITTTDGTSITVTSEAGFPAVPFIISVDTEAMLVTNVATTTWTVTRGYESSTAATHLNGAAVYHDWSAGEANSAVLGPSSATDAHLAVFDGATGKRIKDGGAVPEAGLPTTGGTMSGAINMGNQDISYLKLLKLNGEIDDGNSGTAKVINWNTGIAHKSTLTGNVTLAFEGYGANQIPYMTSNTAPSGVVTSNIASPTNAHYFFHSGAQGSVILYANNWAKYAFVEGVTKIPVAFTARFYNGGYKPATFKLEASNDDSSWTQLINATITTENLTQYTFSNATAYRYFRWTTPSDSAPSELSIQEGVTNPAAPCFLTLKLTQDATGGRTVTWPATVKGTPLYDLAANAVTNLLFYWDGTYYWVLNNNRWVSTVPASATAKGIAGQYTANGSYFYYCSATDTWVRTALATWS